MLAVALLPALLFGLFALVPMLDTSSDGDREDDPDLEGLGIVDTDGDADPDVEEPDVEDPDVVDPDVVAPDVVSLTGEDGATVDVEATPTEDGIPVDVDGSELGDVIASPTAPTTPIQLNGLGGDDTIGFGYSTSVAPGLGDDELTLTITQAALDNGDGANTFNISNFSTPKPAQCSPRAAKGPIRSIFQRVMCSVIRRQKFSRRSRISILPRMFCTSHPITQPTTWRASISLRSQMAPIPT